ncbi:MAG: protein-glutamate O-methyltransferase CheR [Spirochaetales bacterium]|nr:protein-glutamate O-methyltransferase CheR [Spirochaetales bacterium]
MFKDLLTERFGLAFEEHRHRFLESGLAGRMEDCGIDSAAAYRRRIENDGDELSRLIDAVTNNLSRFFRNRGQLQAVTDFIVPEFTGGRAISVWVAGCATGEEPYSLAMTLADSLPESADFHITATDISRRALKIALAGTYSPRRARAVSESARTRYFSDDNGRLSVSASLRRRVSFVEHNVIEAPVVHDADLVLCRNVLTYLAPQARRAAIRTLRESIAAGGFLIIGNSETLPRGSGFNAITTPPARIYRRPCPPSE